MNDKAVEDIVKSIKARIEAEKMGGAMEFDFSKEYLALAKDFGPQEREQLKKRFAENGWDIEHKTIIHIR